METLHRLHAIALLKGHRAMKKILAVICISSLFICLKSTATAQGCDSWIDDEYEAYCEEIGVEYGICPELLEAIIERESSGKASATNGGCKGLMQIYEKYHKDRMTRLGVIDIYDPYGNILVGTDYLVELAEKYEDVGVVLSVYHGEKNAVGKAQEGILSSYVSDILERSEQLERSHGK